MGVTLSGVVLIFLCIGLSKWTTEGCSCIASHPQRLFCRSQIVMRAVITGVKMNYNHKMYGPKTIQYTIKVIKVFRGFDVTKKIQYAYTDSESSRCGIKLKRGQYLLSGEIYPGGFFISLCGFIQRWDKLSQTLKNNIKHRYEMGCDCTISKCFQHPCQSSSNTECILTDMRDVWSRHRNMIYKNVCIKHSSGSCSWHTGSSNSTDSIMFHVSRPKERVFLSKRKRSKTREVKRSSQRKAFDPKSCSAL
ncbi:metalloproteinase inhibitor 3-like [Paramisgurnus dabryanus]|uniref:metalloproteinase inhibitor 3-like n=1 Tax=Paramisgurnus dabryanus TaxID=90735 RepID=UPI0031F3FB05